ncbi:MAG: aminotransferase class V-fold PLP-dependent enzyme [candidate division WOR-3 bacterium]|nr:MAG: aminotransferase class V-fold PLP-dependent enzyme [candidate division WOR-3 bacterium]
MVESAEFRRFFPITGKFIYFNHAGTGPLSVPAQRAVERCLSIYSSQAEFDTERYFSIVGEARATVARFIGAKPEEIAFTHNTSEGIYIALCNLPLRENDTILVMDEVFPAVRYVVDNNLPHIKKKYVSFAKQDPIAVLETNLDRNVKVVVVDYVQFLSGETIDLRSFSAFTSEHGLYLVVDGIQGIGALKYDVTDNSVDFLACGCGKWLFGPSGAGFLYVNSRNFDKLRRQHTGWLGAGWTGFEDVTKNPPLYDDARKYEMGTRNILGIQALTANIDILLQYGMQRVEARILKLKEDLRRHFEVDGFEILTPRSGKQSGILSVSPGASVEVLSQGLRRNNIVVSLRNRYLRFSPHFYNSEDEIKQIVDVVGKYRVLK